VVATDGDAEAVRRFEAVVSGNGLTEIVECGVYWWGEKLQGDDAWNLVVAADVVSIIRSYELTGKMKQIG